jgi:thioesterase DpgC
MATFCREQAHCHFSPALIANLEKHWDAANRRA